jgi:phosphoglycerol transferase MdoB-like AlkP superfamily enzyme
LIPHTPFIYGQDGITQSPLNTSYNWGLDRGSVYESYSQQTQYADSLLGDFVDRLKDEGLYEASTILVTGDHGLRPHSLDTGLPIEIGQETAQIPMIIKAPGIDSQVLDVDYQHVDFAATLFDVLDRQVPTDFGGLSAFATERPERDKIIYVDEDNLRYWEYAYRTDKDKWELVRAVEGPMPLSPEISDIVSRTD